MEDPALVLAPRPSANTGDLKSPASAPRIVYKELRGSNLPFHRAIRRHKSARKPQLMPPTGSLSLSFGKNTCTGKEVRGRQKFGGVLRNGCSTKRRKYEKTQLIRRKYEKTQYEKTQVKKKRDFQQRDRHNLEGGTSKTFCRGGFYEASITWDPEFQSLFKIIPCLLLRIKFIIGVSLIILQQQTMIQWADISDS